MSTAEASRPNLSESIEPPPPRPRTWWVRCAHRVEDAVVVLAMAVMVLFPLLEIVLRWGWVKSLLPASMRTGISGSTAFVQHGSLAVAMIGGSIAARQVRLLSLATNQMMPKKVVPWARFFSSVVAGVITAFLVYASVQFVLAERQFSEVIAYGVPTWTLELLLPVGFALIAWRLLWHAGDGWRIRLAAFVLAGVAYAALAYSPIDPEHLRWPLIGLILIATALGSPVFAVLGGAALVLFWADWEPIASIPIDYYSLVTNPSLPTIPLFTLAGYFLAEGGASRRLVEVFTAWFGPVRGGPAIVCVLACAFFTSFTGASGVTILALGGLLMPVLVSAGYTERSSLGLLTGSGALGLLFPPCLPLVLYAIIAGVPIGDMFLAAIIPGLILLTLTGMLGVWLGRRGGAERPRFDLRRGLRALWLAKWELLLPVVTLVALFGGWASPVEAAAITAIYAFISQTIINRDLRIFSDTPRVAVECSLVVGGVMLILCVAQGFTNYLIIAQVPDHAVEWVTGSVSSTLVFLLLVNLFLLIVGCIMDIFSAIVVVVPLLLPIGMAFGVDPLHLGVIFLANLELGYLTPPVGMNLFLSSYRFNKPIAEVCISILPILVVQVVGVLLITYVPALTTWLPRLFS